MRLLLPIFLFSTFFFAIVIYIQGFSIAKNELFARSVCDRPIEYGIGSIDERFNLSKAELFSNIEDASAIWEKPSAKNLFAYNPAAQLKIDLVFDRRQSLATEINRLENQLKAGKDDLEARKAEYEKLVREFEGRLTQLNEEVKYYNSRGGAPKEDYDRLVNSQEELRGDAEKLNNLASDLNLEAKKYNTDVGQLNRNVEEFNFDLRSKPEEGIYDSETNKIEIYFVTSQDELVHTLAHELGHTLGVEHILDNADSIMFPFSSESISATVEDVAAINILCAPRSLVQIVMANVSLILSRYKDSR